MGALVPDESMTMSPQFVWSVNSVSILVWSTTGIGTALGLCGVAVVGEHVIVDGDGCFGGTPLLQTNFVPDFLHV